MLNDNDQRQVYKLMCAVQVVSLTARRKACQDILDHKSGFSMAAKVLSAEIKMLNAQIAELVRNTEG